MKLFVVTIVLAMLSSAYGKIFTTCELARILVANGIPKAQLPDWLCIAQYESGFNTAALNTKNANGSSDYGMFQINNRYWCSTTSTPGKDCNIPCAKLLDDNIVDDVACIKTIYNRHGFSAWVAWTTKCNGKPKPTANGCF